MAIPIKAQTELFLYHMNVCSPSGATWKTLVILEDGSLYAVNTMGVVFPIDRSYAGQILKASLKEVLSLYHKCLEYRASYKRMGDRRSYDFQDEFSKLHKKHVESNQKAWDAFKSFSARSNRSVKIPPTHQNTVTSTNDVTFGWFVKGDTRHFNTRSY
jgi:hypothetical protein